MPVKSPPAPSPPAKGNAARSPLCGGFLPSARAELTDEQQGTKDRRTQKHKEAKKREPRRTGEKERDIQQLVVVLSIGRSFAGRALEVRKQTHLVPRGLWRHERVRALPTHHASRGIPGSNPGPS